MLSVTLLIVLLLHLLLRSGRKRGGLGVTVVAIALLLVWLVLANNWVIIPGVN